MATLKSCDFHHASLVSLPSIQTTFQGASKMWGEAMAVGADKSTTFLADTGASHHIVHKPEFFWDLVPLPGPFRINQVLGTVEVTHWGTMVLEVDGENGKQKLTLKEVLLIPGMDFNIVSLQKFRAAHFVPVYEKVDGKVVINKKDPTGGYTQVALLSESKQGRLTLDCKLISRTPTLPSVRQAEALVGSLSMDLLHRRLGHSGEAALHRLLQNNMATGVGQVRGGVSPCDPCKLGKLTRPPHPAVAFTHNTTHALELVVMDLAGPVKPSSLGGASYFLGILDVYTRFSWVFTIRKKI